ncbi:hypothetical protein COCVIDRAFT_43041 [Bipolaris victoriae FI3]|uniref:FAD-binding FR-type domain-containing protein n=1 Tax=Bipolaris victoriae (strain FI3) TaxID=930091 RepID=W7DXS9_BIPV3|nr:hypothetical protein COCVIDRAFT_43041 [Bipolaris victoriae FI3]
MGWPYKFYEHTDAGHLHELQKLYRYGLYAQLSLLLPLAIILGVRGVVWLAVGFKHRNGIYDYVRYRKEGQHRTYNIPSIKAKVSQWKWWLECDFRLASRTYGTRGQLLFGSLCTLWFFFLCFAETGNNYNQLAKRFGMVGTALLPSQILLSFKHANPAVIAFRTTYENINRWHNIIGKIIYVMLTCHFALYLNKYVQTGVLSQVIRHHLFITGLPAFLFLSLLRFTSLKVVRRFSYRAFYMTHLSMAFALPPIIFFHVRPTRMYMIEALSLTLVNATLRRWYAITTQGTVQRIPGTSLKRIIFTVPSAMARDCIIFPGSYVYISRKSYTWFRLPNAQGLLGTLTSNPFTVAAVSEETCELTLIARHRNGPTSHYLDKVASTGYLQDNKLFIRVEGPYKVGKYFPDLIGTSFGRILLFAGGVGATFTWPIYRNILQSRSEARVDMFWAVRCPADASWVADNIKERLVDDSRMHIYFTGDTWQSDDNERLSTKDTEGRPNLKNIVDNAFEDTQDRVALLVSGPEGLTKDLRRHVDAWVKQGRDVWWHEESFSH